jgi:hypothetical protein
MGRANLFEHLSARGVIERLLDWCEQARRSGRERRADALLLLAWKAYDGCLTNPHLPTARTANDDL